VHCGDFRTPFGVHCGPGFLLLLRFHFYGPIAKSGATPALRIAASDGCPRTVTTMLSGSPYFPWIDSRDFPARAVSIRTKCNVAVSGTWRKSRTNSLALSRYRSRPGIWHSYPNSRRDRLIWPNEQAIALTPVRAVRRYEPICVFEKGSETLGCIAHFVVAKHIAPNLNSLSLELSNRVPKAASRLSYSKRSRGPTVPCGLRQRYTNPLLRCRRCGRVGILRLCMTSTAWASCFALDDRRRKN
jgi:hypothetical protein